MLLAAVTSCTSNVGADRSGGQVVRLSFATVDGDVNGYGGVGPGIFVEQLEKVSGGRLRVDVSTTYGDGAGDAESKLLRSIALGKLDGGWPATRAFANAGIDGLRAVEAPMTLTSYAAVRDLVQGPASTIVLGRLDDTGVVDLGLVVGPLRRPFATRSPLLAPADWRWGSLPGLPLTGAGGHRPLPRRCAGGRRLLSGSSRIRDGTLRGGEFDVSNYANNGFGIAAGNLPSNVVLWPKVEVLTLSRAKFDALTDQQRQWVRTAATRAVRASVVASFDESADVRRLCAQGVRIVDATDQQLSALRSAVAPVIDQLARDPVEAPLLDTVQAAASRHPQPDILAVPASCREAEGAQAAPEIPHQDSALPGGTFRVAISASDVDAAGVSNGPGWSGRGRCGSMMADTRCRAVHRGILGATAAIPSRTVPWRRGGFAARDISPISSMIRSDCPDSTGARCPASGAGDNQCDPLAPYPARWSLDGRTLTFTDIPGAQTPPHLTLKPWERIG